MKKYDLTYVTNEMPHGLSIKQIESLIDNNENIFQENMKTLM